VTASEPVSRQQLTFEVAAADVPRAEALLELAGAETIALRDAADDPVLEPEPSTTPLWPHVVVIAQFPAGAELEPLRELLRSSCEATRVMLRPVAAADWEAGMRQSFAARPFGRRLWLAPAEDAVPPDRLTVRLHMGYAFGTGEHPTTALCLDWLDETVQRGSTIIDYGCGSGVLALAALALGAQYAFAIDNDPQALTATRANAALNGVTSQRLFVGLPETLPSEGVDLLAANILAAPLIAHAPLFAERVRPGGVIALSGILERHAEQVAAAYRPAFAGFETAIRDGWVRLTARRDTH
jgi:ribosomal protein L11 methyltransferase